MPEVKLLYVEDELFLARIVKESLESRGFEVFLESDGAKVLTAFRKVQPDICVLDVMLPNMDGFELAEEIRKMDSGIPILFLTAKTQTEDVVKGFGLGGNDYIRKPFSMEELIVRINNAMRHKADEPSKLSGESVQIGRYIFQLNRQILQIGNEEKKLSYRESELLKVLVSQKNNIVDRKDILNLLWGSDSFFNSRTLDVYITKLRSYLKGDPSIEIITIKGIGYRMAV
ncbi:MAG TPA: response regulator transcription factor [Chitinophagaceae bacterium]|nr:response regulator transcription factor [Chitinophagaceae bacterium]